MRRNLLRDLFARGEVAVNGWLSIPSAYSAEGTGHQGFDSVTVDLQHGMIGFDAAVTMLQALSSTPAVPLVRVGSNNPAQVMHLLDAGAYGVICPLVSNADEARSFVSSCRYPPRGSRSYGPSRGLLYGGRDYVAHANETILAIPMIETVEAVEQIDEILGIDGVDMVYVGPNDLALALGESPGAEPGGTRAAAAIERVLGAAKKAGKPAGIFCSGPAGAQMRARQGFDLVTPGNDFGTMTSAMAAAVQTVRGGDKAVLRAGTGY